MSLIVLDSASTLDRKLIGGKAWSVQRMLGLGIPVPPAFVIGTDVCAEFYAHDRQLPQSVIDALPGAIAELERLSGKTFGKGAKPLLVSVRSGAAISMPGMMDTVLNLGMTDEVEHSLGELVGSASFAADTRERFVTQYTRIVGHAPDADPWKQLIGAISAVFESWQSTRAQAYRRDRKLADDAGTAVTVQAMVFGNLDEQSGTGVLFSRNPMNGAPEPYGEWLTRGQGEEVVSGVRTPEPLATLAEKLPSVHEELMGFTTLLERDGADVQDIEFTVEAGRLWLLQTRSAKRSPQAAVSLAVALCEDGLITSQQALARVSAEQIKALLEPHIEAIALKNAKSLASGKLACSGVVSGTLITDVEAAERRALDGESIILARPTTDPDDVHAMSVVAGVLTELGGSTSHAAVVSREIGVPCIVGCGAGTLMPLAGRVVTLDASAGQVFDGALPIVSAATGESEDLKKLAAWARRDGRHPESASLGEMLSQRAHS